MIHISYPPTQGPLCLPWGASSRVCFHCAIQNKWEPQMRTGHLRNLNHEVRKKNTKNTHIIVCCSLCLCSLHDHFGCVGMVVCVSLQEKRVKSIVFILRTCCILNMNTIYFGTISFWSCLSKQIKCNDIQNINTLIQRQQNGIGSHVFIHL